MLENWFHSVLNCSVKVNPERKYDKGWRSKGDKQFIHRRTKEKMADFFWNLLNHLIFKFKNQLLLGLRDQI